MMALAWACVAIGIDGFENWFDSGNHEMVKDFANLPLEGHHGEASKMEWFESTLLHHFGKTCEILIFLVGAMTIVEIIDHFNGFSTIKRFIKTNQKKTLLWICVFLLLFYLLS